MRYSALSLSCAAALAASAVVPAQDMIGVSWQGNVYAIDSMTGTGMQIGTTGFTNGNSIGTNAMAVDSSGTVWVSYTRVNQADFQTLDTTTGAATVVSTVPYDIRGLAYDGANFWMVSNGSPDTLHQVDPNNGMVTTIGGTGRRSIQALAHDGTTLYCWDLSAGLMTLDTTTGMATDVNGLADGRPMNTAPQFLTVDASGNLFTGREELFAVDKMTGAATLVGSLGPGNGYSDLRGCDFLGSPCFATYGSGCPGSSGRDPSLVIGGCPTAGMTFRTIVSNAAPSAPYVLAISNARGNIPIGNCSLLLGGGFLVVVPGTLDPSGRDVMSYTAPMGTMGVTITCQAFVADMGNLAASAGVEFTIQ